MNPYDPSSLCRKCGSDAASRFKSECGRERIVRTCDGCGHYWEELPLDYDSKEDFRRQAQWNAKCCRAVGWEPVLDEEELAKLLEWLGDSAE